MLRRILLLATSRHTILGAVAILATALVLVTGLRAFAAPHDTAAGPALLHDLDTPQGNPSLNSPAVSRSRNVAVHTALLNQSEILTLNLFSDVNLTAVRDQLETSFQGHTTWTGRIADTPFSEVTLVNVGEVVIGNISLPDAFYQIRYLGNGTHVVQQANQDGFAPEAAAIAPDVPPTSSAAGTNAPAADNGATIDVLVIYTTAARQAAGGTLAMQALISLIVNSTNQSFANSQVNPRVRLVHAAEVAYPETGDVLLDLTRFQNPSDGYADSVHTLRNTYRADLVSILTHNAGNYCGISYLMSPVSSYFEAYAFNLTQWQCASSNYSYAHEVGHNLGSQHDHANASGPAGAYPYSYGYQAPNGAFRTIMAYRDGCPAGCPRINYWSNPNISYAGQPTGVSNWADNRRSINDTAYTVANFRQSLPPPAALTVDPSFGQVSSYFAFAGVQFTPSQMATVSVNGYVLSNSIPVEPDGTIEFQLATDQADEGAYFVTVTAGQSNDTAGFFLNSDAPLNPPSGSGPTLNVPAGIALTEFVYLPAVLR